MESPVKGKALKTDLNREKRDTAICILYTKYDKPTTEIADILDMTRARIGQLLSENGINKRKINEVRQYTKEELSCKFSEASGVGCATHRAMLIGYLVEDKNCQEIAEDLDVSDDCVLKNLKKKGVKINNPTHCIDKAKELAIIKTYLTEKKKTKEIANEFGVHWQSVRRVLKTKNVKVRLTACKDGRKFYEV